MFTVEIVYSLFLHFLSLGQREGKGSVSSGCQDFHILFQVVVSYKFSLAHVHSKAYLSVGRRWI